MRLDRTVGIAVVLLGSLASGGCTLGYYWQAAGGHLDLMGRREPVAELLADPATPESLAQRLQRADEALAFAHEQLALPDRGSYRHYADVERPFVVWNVVAAPEFSLEPRRWCFPLVGCVSYRGYFAESSAEKFAAGLRQSGDDVLVGGVRAYSTLGRLDDPLLSTFIALPDYQLAGLIFHELAHQQLYIRDDSAFNESFATTVEREGLRLWLDRDAGQRCEFERWMVRRTEVLTLFAGARDRLAAIYAAELSPRDKRSAKAAAFQALRDDYQRLRDSWSGPPYFDAWLGAGLNNARLAALATYDDWVPAFRQLLRESDGDWPRFYAAVAELGQRDPAAREAALGGLADRAVSAPPAFASCPDEELTAARQAKPRG